MTSMKLATISILFFDILFNIVGVKCKLKVNFKALLKTIFNSMQKLSDRCSVFGYSNSALYSGKLYPNVLTSLFFV